MIYSVRNLEYKVLSIFYSNLFKLLINFCSLSYFSLWTCSYMYMSMYHLYLNILICQCITCTLISFAIVEDPSENFQRVRDFVDVKNCQGLSSFQPSKLLKGFSEDMQKEAREKFKLNRVIINYFILVLLSFSCAWFRSSKWNS